MVKRCIVLTDKEKDALFEALYFYNMENPLSIKESRKIKKTLDSAWKKIKE